MTRFIERTLPPGDRDDDTLPPSDVVAASPAVAGREPEETAPLVPGLDLHLPRIEQALDEVALALADLKRARTQGDWPMLEASALRLKIHTRHVAEAISNARAFERSPLSTRRSKAS